MARPRDGLDEVYAAAAAEQTLARRRRTADLLGALGVDVIDVPAESLAPALADHYLALKARGLLEGPAGPRAVRAQAWLATRSSRAGIGSRSPVKPRATARRPRTNT